MTGDKYFGEWNDGYRHGYGAMLLPYEGVWVSEWKSHKWLSGRKYTKEEVPSDIMALFKKD